MKKKQAIEKRPNYFHGQLLLEDDFLAEQNYHISARRQHDLNLHGYGIVRGFEVVRKSGQSVLVNPGFAIDRRGQEICIKTAVELELSEFGSNDVVNIVLAYEDPLMEVKGKGVSNSKWVDANALISAETVKQHEWGVLLATVQLDSKGKIGSTSINNNKTDYVGKGSVTAVKLAQELNTGWLRMPFRPIPLTNIQADEKEIPPAFRVGPTEALSPKPEETESKDKGAAGTMAIAVPPAVKKIYRFRIAGSRNEDKITFRLLLGGWDPKKSEHVSKTLLDETISSSPFMKTYEIQDSGVDGDFHTVSLWLRCSGRTAVSLVAVEFGYY